MGIEQEIREALLAERDEGYKAFHQKLIPTVDEARVLGVRMPAQRKIAKAYKKDPRLYDYLALSQHTYMEEVNVHGFLLDAITDFDVCVVQLDHLLSMVDNWANCDSLMPMALKKHPDQAVAHAFAWMDSDAPYTVRFGILVLMRFALAERFDETHLRAVAACSCDEYYVNMAVAWYFSMALAKQYEKTLPWISERRLPEWVHKKSIQKAVESRQVSAAHKEVLKSYR